MAFKDEKQLEFLSDQYFRKSKVLFESTEALPAYSSDKSSNTINVCIHHLCNDTDKDGPVLSTKRL